MPALLPLASHPGALWRPLAGLILLALIGLGGLVLADETRRPEAISGAIRQAFTDARLGDAKGFEYVGGRELSHFSECIGLSTPLNREEQPPIWFSLTSPALLWIPPVPICRTLQDEAEGRTSSRYYPYSRYWHGYRLVTEPVLSRFSYGTLQGACAVLMALGGLALGAGATRLAGWMPIALAAIGLCLGTETPFLWLTPTHAISFSALMFGAALVMRLAKDGAGLQRLAGAGFLAGGVYNFFDFLYNPDLLMFLAGWAVVVAQPAGGDGDSGRRLRQAVLVQIATVAGYVAMWVLKWALVWGGGMIYGATLWFPADHVNRWLAGGEHGYIPFAATAALLRQSFATAPSAVLMTACAVGVVGALAIGLRQGKGGALLALCGLWLAPLAILEAKAGHTIMHAPFTWRFMPWAAAMTLAAAISVVRERQTLRQPSA